MRQYNFLILNILGIVALLFLAGCSASINTIKQDGVSYGVQSHACTNLPDFMDNVKEGLGQSKVCFRGGAGVVIVPSDYPEDKL